MTEPIPLHEGNKAFERKALADQAEELLETRAFTQSILALRKRYFEMMMAAETDATRLALIERIRALEDIPQQLRILINDEKVAQARKK